MDQSNERGMTEEDRVKITEIHDYLFKSREGSPSRAKQLDTALEAIRAGKITARAILWVAAFITALGLAVAEIKGWVHFR